MTRGMEKDGVHGTTGATPNGAIAPPDATSDVHPRYALDEFTATDLEVGSAGLTMSEILATMLMAIFSFGGVWLMIAFTSWPPHIPLACCVLLIAFFLFGSWLTARCRSARRWPSMEGLSKRIGQNRAERILEILKWHADFGDRLWHFPSLWFVVFVVGVYAAAVSAIVQYLPAQAAGNITSVWLTLIQNIILATFLAVLTSVLSNTFTSVGQLTGRITELMRTSGAIYAKVESACNDVSRMNAEVQQTARELDLLGATLRTAAKARRISERISALVTQSRALTAREEAMEPICEAVVSMCRDVEGYHAVALHPLLAPGQMPPTDDRAPDTIAEIASRLVDRPDERPHYAYMSAAVGRYFASEAIERAFPGVILHVTSFAYYVRTVARIVRALKPWYDRFEFYTLMPKCPVELFRFANSTDIQEWQDFLRDYHSFHESRSGVWKRYFAFTEADGQRKEFVSRKDITYHLSHGYVLTQPGSWLPRIVRQSERASFFPDSANQDDIQKFLKENPFYDEVGTLAGSFPDTLPRELGWRPLDEVLLEYHALDAGAPPASVDERFTYRSIDDCLQDFDRSLFVESRTLSGADEVGLQLKRSFRVPTDLFAIRDKTISDIYEKWIFAVGLDYIRAREAKSDVALAFAPVFELRTLSHRTSGTTNNNAASDIRNLLERLFCDPDTSKTLSHRMLVRASEGANDAS